MAKLYNLARMSSETTGTGTITLGSAVSGYLSFAAAGVQNGDTVSYAIKDGSNSEAGRGVYTSSGTTLTRNVLKSTNSDAAINLSGSAEVFITGLAEDFSDPRPSTLATQSSATSLSTGTWTTIAFNTEAWDDLGWHDNTTNNSRITVSVTGRYRIIATIAVASADNGHFNMAIAVDGTRVRYEMKNFGSSPPDPKASAMAVVMPLTAGQYVELHGYQTGTGSTNTTTARTTLSVELM